MEKTQFNGHDEASETEREVFVFSDSAVGKTFLIRDCNDAQLERAATELQNQYAEMQKNLSVLLMQMQSCAAGETVMRYELDRRRRSIRVASSFNSNVSRLS